MMKLYPRLLAVLAWCLAGCAVGEVFLVMGCRKREPAEFVSTGISSQWLTFTTAEEGFEIKHPPHWRRNQSPGVVSFSDGYANIGIRRLYEPTRIKMEKLYPERTRSALNHRKVKVGALMGEQSTGVVGFFDQAGNMEVKSVTLARGSFTYVITWSLGRGSSKAPASSGSICEEMVATFKFVDVKHSDYLTHTDPISGFSFEYPYNWIFNDGGMASKINVTNAGSILIRVELMANTTVEEFLRQQGHQVTDVAEVTEHFLHRLPGRRCRWLDREAYILENQGRTFVVSIREAPQLGPVSRKSIDDLLDSLRF